MSNYLWIKDSQLKLYTVNKIMNFIDPQPLTILPHNNDNEWVAIPPKTGLFDNASFYLGGGGGPTPPSWSDDLRLGADQPRNFAWMSRHM